MSRQRLVVLGAIILAGVSLFGFALGAVGAAFLGRDLFLRVPEVHLAPQTVFHLGGFGVTNTLLSAWLTTVVIILLFVLGTRRMRLVPTGLQNLLEAFVEVLYGFVVSVAGERFGRQIFPLLATIFVFVAFNAWIALLPIYPTVGLKEGGADHVTTHLLRSAGTDINMPLALAIISFLFAEVSGFRAHGLSYLREFVRFGGLFRAAVRFKPSAFFYGVIDASVGGLETLSHLVRLISFTFRLFGNMVAGEIVLLMVTFLLSFSAVLVVFYGLELLVGGVQALIFVGLTLVFTVMAVTPREEEEGEHQQGAAH